MRKAIRQTKGIIAHLISAYRGILRHAYLAGLIMTLWGGCLTAEAETYPWLKQASGTGYIQTDDQSLKGVTVPSTVESVGRSAFAGCLSLEERLCVRNQL